MLWDHLREEEFENALERSQRLCIFSLGCMEKHGQHLPLGTDSMVADALVDGAARIEDAVVLHLGSWLGEVSAFHLDENPAAVHRLGNIALSQQLILSILEELCDEASRNGFNKILIVSGHGGNTPLLQHFLRCQGYKKRPYATLWTSAYSDEALKPQSLLNEITKDRSAYPLITDRDIQTLEAWAKTGYGGGHADFSEVGLMLAEHPDLVAVDKYEAENSSRQSRGDEILQEGVYLTNSWFGHMPNCYCGFPPHGCSEGIGSVMKKISCERLARIFRRLKTDNGDLIRLANMEPHIQPS